MRHNFILYAVRRDASKNKEGKNWWINLHAITFLGLEDVIFGSHRKLVEFSEIFAIEKSFLLYEFWVPSQNHSSLSYYNETQKSPLHFPLLTIDSAINEYLIYSIVLKSYGSSQRKKNSYVLFYFYIMHFKRSFTVFFLPFSSFHTLRILPT